MANSKSKIIDKIDKKAKKIAKNREKEAFVFEFFRQIDEANMQAGNIQTMFFLAAIESLEEKVRTIDAKAKVDVTTDVNNLARIQGVTVFWSPQFAKDRGLDKTTYIDVSLMLLF
jgi:hypothetical protein